MRLSTLFAPVLLLAACPPASPDVVIEPAAPDTLDDLQVQVTPAVIGATYAWAADGVPLPDLATNTVPAARTAKGQTWTVTVSEAGDNRGTAQVVIGNAGPSATVSLPDKGTTGRDLVATVEGMDPDDDEVTFAISWTVDGEPVSESSATLPGDKAPRGSTVSIEVIPSDGELVGDPVTASTVMENGIPSITSATISPEVPVEADEVVCIAAGWADPDGDPEGYRTRWTVNGADASTEAVLTGADFARGDEIVCWLTPWDGSIEGDPVQSQAVTVGNTAPTATGVTFAPAAPKVGDTVEASLVGVLDVDGDSVSVEWSWDNDGVDLRTPRATLEIQTEWAHRTLRVTGVPTDGDLEGEPIIASVEVANSDPDLRTASIGGLESGELRHGAKPSVTSTTATDPDGDELTLSYDWAVNGATVSTEARCNDCALERGDMVNLTITASDEFGGSDDWTWSGTVQNSPPTSFSIEADSSSGKLGADVHCDVVADSTDADGDTLTYTTTWTVNGSAWTGTTETDIHADDTIPAEEVRLDDSFRCAMTVTDGTDTASATSASKTFSVCPPVPGFVGSTTPMDLTERSGFCFYLGQPKVSCDDTCTAMGGGNHAAAAGVALTSRCGGPMSGEPAYDFLTGDNEGGWLSSYSGTSSAKSLGHGIDGGIAYGACGTGTTSVGAWPGQSNTNGSRSLVCACF